jgi:hypothetical protein
MVGMTRQCLHDDIDEVHGQKLTNFRDRNVEKGSRLQRKCDISMISDPFRLMF